MDKSLPAVIARDWSPVTGGAPDFSLMSFNILAPVWTHPPNYSYMDAKFTTWDYRRSLIVKEIVHHHPDIVCLQEVDAESFLSKLLPELRAAGYDGYHIPNYSHEGVALVWNSKLFKFVDQSNGAYNQLAYKKYTEITRDASKKDSTEARILGSLSQIAHHNVYAVVVLEHVGKKQQLVVGTTHLWWGSYTDAESYQLQCGQLPLLLEVLSKVSQVHNHCPIVVCGDMNAQQKNAVYHLLSNGVLPRDHPDITLGGKLAPFERDIVSPLPPLLSSYKCSPNGEPIYTLEFFKCIDYIFFSQKGLETVAVLKVFDHRKMKPPFRLPREDYGSDHISLMSTFKFK